MVVIYNLPDLTLKVSDSQVIAHFKFPRHEFKSWLRGIEMMSESLGLPAGKNKVYASKIELPKPDWLLHQLRLYIDEVLADSPRPEAAAALQNDAHKAVIANKADDHHESE